MSDSNVFAWVCANLEEATSFSAIEARGTVRIALKKSGLDAAGISAAQMQVVVKRVLPDELVRRGIDDGQDTCDHIAAQLKDQRFDIEVREDTPEDVFARLGN
jgi:hypothetical protein